MTTTSFSGPQKKFKYKCHLSSNLKKHNKKNLLLNKGALLELWLGAHGTKAKFAVLFFQE